MGKAENRLPLLVALLLVILAGALRIHRAQTRTSIWGDEAQELALLETSPDLPALIRSMQDEGHPPLHYLLEWPVYRAFGKQFVLARWLQVLCGTLSVAFVIALAGNPAGWIFIASLAGGLLLVRSKNTNPRDPPGRKAALADH